VPATGFIDDAGRVEVPVITTTGQGQHYQVESAEGWWRDFAELQATNEQRALSFVRRRGDPRGELTPERPIHTGRWVEHLNGLRTAALCWESRSDFEISKFIDDDERVAFFLRKLSPTWAEDTMGLTYRGLNPIPLAHTLAGYLIASAVSALRRRVSMRRCLYCSSWFELHRAEAMFCSPSCRAAHHNERLSPHGLDFARDDAQRDDTLASPVARAGRGRESPPGEAQLRDPKGSQGARRAHGRGARAPRRRRSASAKPR
jgi:hypothetical protein